MPKSTFVAALDQVQKPTTAVLKALGFKKRGRTYNRAVGDGLVHVVSFQMGEFPIGDYVVPGLRESYYGRFTVNLGVMVPAVSKLEDGHGPRGFVHESECEIRERLGVLAYGEDTWWDLDHQVATTAKQVVEFLDSLGLPFLDQFENHASILAYLERTGELPFNNPARSALVGALICFDQGKRRRAASFFDRAMMLGGSHRGFLEHVRELRKSCGL